MTSCHQVSASSVERIVDPCEVHVSNIPINEADPLQTGQFLKNFFSAFGKVVSVNVHYGFAVDEVNGKPNCYAFVKFENMSSAEQLLRIKNVAYRYPSGTRILRINKPYGLNLQDVSLPVHPPNQQVQHQYNFSFYQLLNPLIGLDWLITGGGDEQIRSQNMALKNRMNILIKTEFKPDRNHHTSHRQKRKKTAPALMYTNKETPCCLIL